MAADGSVHEETEVDCVNAECIVLRSAEAKVPTPVGQAALGSGS